MTTEFPSERTSRACQHEVQVAVTILGRAHKVRVSCLVERLADKGATGFKISPVVEIQKMFALVESASVHSA